MSHEQIGREFIGRMRTRQPCNVVYLRIGRTALPLGFLCLNLIIWFPVSLKSCHPNLFNFASTIWRKKKKKIICDLLSTKCRVCLVNAIYPITSDVIFKACQFFGPILRLGIANDRIVEVLVEFANHDSAATAVEKVKDSLFLCDFASERSISFCWIWMRNIFPWIRIVFLGSGLEPSWAVSHLTRNVPYFYTGTVWCLTGVDKTLHLYNKILTL